MPNAAQVFLTLSGFYCLEQVQARLGGEPRQLGGEPRVVMENMQRKLNLAMSHDWKATSSCNFGRCDWFKLQGKLWNADGKLPTTVLIRSDWHPQPLLDDKLNFEGGALEFGKEDDQSRWWDLIPISVDLERAESSELFAVAAVYAFATRSSKGADERQYLAMDGDDIILKPLPEDRVLEDLQVQWHIQKIGSALTFQEALTLGLVLPATVATAAVTGGIGGILTVQAAGTSVTLIAADVGIALAIASGTAAGLPVAREVWETAAKNLFAH